MQRRFDFFILKIPRELEKYMTISKLDDNLTQSEIRKLIIKFCNDQEIEQIHEVLLNELSLSFKGLSEFEIYNILSLAVSDEGTITHADLNLIFEQKKQLIQKSGILEMIPLNESLDDIGGLNSLKRWLKRKEKISKIM